MTIAIRRENGDLIWFDAVLNYSRNFESKITHHPIEDGSVITDHVFKENPKFSIDGIITNADFNMNRPVISASDASKFELSKKQFFNSQPINEDPRYASLDNDGNLVYSYDGGPVIRSSNPKFEKYLPESISQFTGSVPPSVSVEDRQRPDWVFQVEDVLKETERNHEIISVLEFDGNLIKRLREGCYISEFKVSENPDTGDAILVNLEVEQVTFVTLRDEVLSKDVISKLNKPKGTKGNQSPTNTTVTGPGVVDAKKAPTETSTLDKITGKEAPPEVKKIQEATK